MHEFTELFTLGEELLGIAEILAVHDHVSVLRDLVVVGTHAFAARLLFSSIRMTLPLTTRTLPQEKRLEGQFSAVALAFRDEFCVRYVLPQP